MNPPGSRPGSSPGARPDLSLAHRRERRALEVGLVASSALHLLLIALYALLGRGAGFGALATPEARPFPVPEGTRIVQLVELLPDELAPPNPPEEPQEEPRPQPAVEVTPQAEPEVAAPEIEPEETDEAGRTVAERLRPRLVDPRLWAPLDQGYLELTDEERAQLLLDGMIRSWNDSVAVALAMAERAADWTYTDDQGRRWGLASGRLYLGTFSIPLPGIELASWQRQDAFSNLPWIQSDLARGAAAAEVRDTWVERARAIRERLEAERNGSSGTASADAGDDGAGNPR